MKIEYVITSVVGLFIFGYILDIVSGPFSLALTSPFAFLQASHVSTYPFTTVSITAKTLAIFITTVLIVQTISGAKYILGSAMFFIIAALMELYAIQQIATQSSLISLQWTLGISYAAVALLIPCFLYLVIGIVKAAHHNLTADPYGLDEDSRT